MCSCFLLFFKKKMQKKNNWNKSTKQRRNVKTKIKLWCNFKIRGQTKDKENKRKKKKKK